MLLSCLKGLSTRLESIRLWCECVAPPVLRVHVWDPVRLLREIFVLRCWVIFPRVETRHGDCYCVEFLDRKDNRRKGSNFSSDGLLGIPTSKVQIYRSPVVAEIEKNLAMSDGSLEAPNLSSSSEVEPSKSNSRTRALIPRLLRGFLALPTTIDSWQSHFDSTFH